MAIVFACIVPHTPLLMPTVGKEKLAELAGTTAALQQLERDLYVTQPETILIVTPHGDAPSGALSINLSPKYVSDFSRFGDLTTKLEWRADVRLIDRLREFAKERGLPLTLTSAESLDYGAAVPLSYLTSHLPGAKVVPLASSDLEVKAHYDIGKALKTALLQSTQRIAVIASADLSHRAGDNAPEGISPAGVAYDNAIASMVADNDLASVIDLDEAAVADAQSCGSRALAAAFGLLDDVRHGANVLCYEKPFGVGYLTAQMRIE